ncbi:acyl-CoA ligase (AMP-forming), exosortase A system-associated [Thalassotalea maritima]|uniref:acyl-CoA ligase (AMP-forming), exosortase A system-associated n=1 Tax=Thalassotalea maritima TaxID=3242416 RepID=UPI00352718C4
MLTQIHDIIFANHEPSKTAITHGKHSLSYRQLQQQTEHIASSLVAFGVEHFDRVGIYLPKTFEFVLTTFATSKAGGVFVPINPILKAPQVEYIINDCDIKVLVTSWARFVQIQANLDSLASLQTVIITDDIKAPTEQFNQLAIISWHAISQQGDLPDATCPNTSDDMAAIFYTSGSTGKPKGVVLSHANIIIGAQSVAKYLNNSQADKILAVLPFSFDYGFSQLTTGLLVGGEVIMLDYLLANDVLNAIEKHQITGLAAVPPLWTQLCKLDWQNKARSLRYITNSGGAMSPSLLEQIIAKVPQVTPYLMYGLTEAFRSTYLAPEKVKQKPNSIGQAIPNAEIKVLRADGSECDIDEPGELVHLGPLVSLGYWNNPDKTSARFKYAPQKPNGIINKKMAVYSGDIVSKDADGDLYFVSRNDEMIKSSGYRISPTEVEECLMQSQLVDDCVVLGCKHQELGQAILAIVSLRQKDLANPQLLLNKYCQQNLPNFMVPADITVLDELPKNDNGKLDRASLAKRYQQHFE